VRVSSGGDPASPSVLEPCRIGRQFGLEFEGSGRGSVENPVRNHARRRDSALRDIDLGEREIGSAAHTDGRLSERFQCRRSPGSRRPLGEEHLY